MLYLFNDGVFNDGCVEIVVVGRLCALHSSSNTSITQKLHFIFLSQLMAVDSLRKTIAALLIKKKQNIQLQMVCNLYINSPVRNPQIL